MSKDDRAPLAKAIDLVSRIFSACVAFALPPILQETGADQPNGKRGKTFHVHSALAIWCICWRLASCTKSQLD